MSCIFFYNQHKSWNRVKFLYLWFMLPLQVINLFRLIFFSSFSSYHHIFYKCFLLLSTDTLTKMHQLWQYQQSLILQLIYFFLLYKMQPFFPGYHCFHLTLFIFQNGGTIFYFFYDSNLKTFNQLFEFTDKLICFLCVLVWGTKKLMF